jgi:hypothetical protein
MPAARWILDGDDTPIDAFDPCAVDKHELRSDGRIRLSSHIAICHRLPFTSGTSLHGATHSTERAGDLSSDGRVTDR